MNAPKLDRDARIRLAARIKHYLDEELDLEIGNMDAEFLIDYLATTLGASFYNKGLKDAQALLSRKMDDLSEEFHALEQPEDPVR